MSSTTSPKTDLGRSRHANLVGAGASVSRTPMVSPTGLSFSSSYKDNSPSAKSDSGVTDKKTKKKKKKVSLGRLLSMGSSRRASTGSTSSSNQELEREKEKAHSINNIAPGTKTPSPKTFSSVPSGNLKGSSVSAATQQFSTIAEDPQVVKLGGSSSIGSASSTSVETAASDDVTDIVSTASTPTGSPTGSGSDDGAVAARSSIVAKRKKSLEKRVSFFGLDEPDKTESVVCHEFLMSAQALDRSKAASVGNLASKSGTNTGADSGSSNGIANFTIFQDWLGVRALGEPAFTRKWSLVHNNALYLYESFDSKHPVRVVLLDNVTLAEHGTCTFKLTSRAVNSRDPRVLYLNAGSPQLKEQWMKLLRRADLNSYKALVPRRSKNAKGFLVSASKDAFDLSTFSFMMVTSVFAVMMESFDFIRTGGANYRAITSK